MEPICSSSFSCWYSFQTVTRIGLAMNGGSPWMSGRGLPRPVQVSSAPSCMRLGNLSPYLVDGDLATQLGRLVDGLDDADPVETFLTVRGDRGPMEDAIDE